MSSKEKKLLDTFKKIANALPEDQQPIFMALVTYRFGNRKAYANEQLGWNVKAIECGQRKLKVLSDIPSVTRKKKLISHHNRYKEKKQKKENKQTKKQKKAPEYEDFRKASTGVKFNFSGLQARHGKFGGSTIIGADLSNSDLTGATLRYVNWSRNYFANANLSGIEAQNSKFEQCIFRNADLSGADFTGSWFTNSDLTGCNLKGANLSGTSFWGACLRDADIDETTILAGARIRLDTYKLSGWTLPELNDYYQRGLVIKDLENFPSEVWLKLFDVSNISLAHIHIKNLEPEDKKLVVLTLSGLCGIKTETGQPIMLQHYYQGQKGVKDSAGHYKRTNGYIFLLQSPSPNGLDEICALLDKEELLKTDIKEWLPTKLMILTEDATEKFAEIMSKSNKNVRMDRWVMQDRILARLPETRLRHYLMNSFKVKQLRDFIENEIERGEEVINHIGSENPSLANFVADIISGLGRRNLIDEAFFHKLKVNCTEKNGKLSKCDLIKEVETIEEIERLFILRKQMQYNN